MRVEVDQSGKIGDTKVPTALSFSNGDSLVILIPATVKRKCILELRKRGKSGPTLYLQLFAVGLYLLLKDHISSLDQITIDIEYMGHDAKIKEQLLNLFLRANGFMPEATLDFRYIGKKSNAHEKAFAVFTGQIRPDRIIGFREMIAEF